LIFYRRRTETAKIDSKLRKLARRAARQMR